VKNDSYDQGQVNIFDYAIGLLDVLNQKHYLSQWGVEQDFVDMRPKSLVAFKKTLGTIHQLRKALSEFTEEFNGEGRPPEFRSISFPPDIDAFFEASESHVKTSAFSDTVLVYTPVYRERGVSHSKSVLGVMIGIAIAHLSGLADGVATRGALEVDLGCEDMFDELYGPCLSKAHQLESELAGHPRILIGDGLIDTLKIMQTEKTDPYLSRVNKDVAEFALSIIREDHDGLNILDYAGQAMKNYFREAALKAGEDADSVCDLYKRAENFASKSKLEFKETNIKLYRRYTKLENYFISSRAGSNSSTY
tara:strand:+ start:136264 stop:137184 length:921 start_codon:yes stop_codon:yes gene_type:complete